MKIPKYFHNLSEVEQSEWIKKKKDKKRSKNAKYRAENYEKEKARQAKYRAENREKVSARYAKYQAENHDKVIARHAKYRAENREKMNDSWKKWHDKTQSQKSAIKFFQMTQAISEIANINTEKK